MTFFLIVVFLFGLCIGSFLNVLIYRLPRGLDIAHGFSMCPTCQHRLYPLDLVPLFSWLFLDGKCRYCKAKISFIYPFVELLNGLIWVGVAMRFGLTVQALAYAIVASCLIVVAFTDWQHMEIPDSMSVVIALMGLVLLAADGSLPISARIIGALCVSVPMALLALAGAMGGGDIKLMAALGLCLGWKLTLFTTFFGAVLGTLVFFLLFKTKAKLGRMIPFGTFLAIGGVCAVFFGDAFIGWYFGLLV